MNIDIHSIISIFVLLIWLFAILVILFGRLFILILPVIRKITGYKKHLSDFLICEGLIEECANSTMLEFLTKTGAICNLKHKNGNDDLYIENIKVMQNGQVFEIINYPINRISNIIQQLRFIAFIILIGSFATILLNIPENFKVSWQWFVSLSGNNVFKVVAVTDLVVFTFILNQFKHELTRVSQLLSVNRVQ